MDILACPIDKHYPLELHVYEEKEEIVEGRVYLLINDFKVDFTEEARKYAKWRYTRLLDRE